MRRQYQGCVDNQITSIDQNSCQMQQIQQCCNRQLTLRQVPHVYGGINIRYIMIVIIPLLIFACLFSYHEAVKQKQEKPFPHATITATACHYPQDIVFRWLMLPIGFSLNLYYLVLFKWIESTAKRIGYQGDTMSWLYPIAQFSILGFYGAIATIDAKGTPFIHGLGAVVFFIILYILSVYSTIVIRDMYSWQTSIMSRNSLLLKQVLMIYLNGVAFYSLYVLLREQKDENQDDPALVIIQWNLTIVCLIWLLTFISEWKHVFVTLKGNFSNTIKRIDIN